MGQGSNKYRCSLIVKGQVKSGDTTVDTELLTSKIDLFQNKVCMARQIYCVLYGPVYVCVCAFQIQGKILNYHQIT